MGLFFLVGLLRFSGIQSYIQIGYKAQLGLKAWEKYIFQLSQSIFFEEKYTIFGDN
jgi:hypothetical protein